MRTKAITVVYPESMADRPPMPEKGKLPCGCIAVEFNYSDVDRDRQPQSIHMVGRLIRPCGVHALETKIQAGQHFGRLLSLPDKWSMFEVLGRDWFPMLDIFLD